ncbi:GyrI-like domain-containing protein [Streptomyces spinosirectus]
MRELRLPRRNAAVATHTGPYDDLDLPHAAVGSFAARSGLRSQDLVEEVYLVGPRDTDQPAAWRTLVAWLLAPEPGPPPSWRLQSATRPGGRADSGAAPGPNPTHPLTRAVRPPRSPPRRRAPGGISRTCRERRR